MKCNHLFGQLFLSLLVIGLASLFAGECYAQRSIIVSTPPVVSVYNFNLGNFPVTRHRCFGSSAEFRPSGKTTPLNGAYARPTPVNELTAMNISFVVKAQSLPPHLYKAFSKVANEMPTKRSAMLRSLMYELPSRMEGTTYVPPSPEQIFGALRKVYYSTDAEVDAYWRSR